MSMGRTLALVLLMVCAGGAFAQPVKDCTKAPPGYRSRCNEAKRVQQICMGLKEPDHRSCVQKNVHYGRLKSDCSAADTPDKKAHCAKNNREMDLADPCSGKTGLDLRACLVKAGVESSPQARPGAATPAGVAPPVAVPTPFKPVPNAAPQ